MWKDLLMGLPHDGTIASPPPPEPVVSAPLEPEVAIVRPFPWVNTAWFAALIVLCYLPVIRHLIWQWSNDDDMGHGFFVPLVAAYIVWMKREKLQALDWSGSNWGLVLIGWAAFQLMIGVLGAELFLQRTALVETIVGAVLFLGGWQVLKELSFPLLLLCFMVPLPSIVYNQITFPLQIFASTVAEKSLGALGIPVLREGNVLELASQKLSVVEACSGIRSLLSLTFLSLVYGYFFDGKPWMKWLLFAATIPIAIIANATRITLTGVISEIDTEFASGFFHLVEGWVIFMVALAMLVLFHRFANSIYHRFHPENVNA
jgi:exosortase